VERVDAEVIAIIGPGLTDSTLVVQPLCDAAKIAAINYAGVEISRSEYMFHFQIGSLEEEPAVIVPPHRCVLGAPLRHWRAVRLSPCTWAVPDSVG
jgi:hypothetical protein